MYGFSDHPNGIPCTRLSADLQGSSRYSVRTASSIEHMFVLPGTPAEAVTIGAIRLDDDDDAPRPQAGA